MPLRFADSRSVYSKNGSILNVRFHMISHPSSSPLELSSSVNSVFVTAKTIAKITVDNTMTEKNMITYRLSALFLNQLKLNILFSLKNFKLYIVKIVEVLN
jgi:hypothetical protein